MKKVISVLILLSISALVFGQNLADYFPTRAGSTFIYKIDNTSSGGKITKQTVYISDTNEHNGYISTVYNTVYSENFFTSETYSVYPEKVTLTMVRNILGQITRQSYDILRLPGQQWRVETGDPGEYYLYRTEQLSQKFGDITYDVIGVEKNIFAKGVLRVNEYSYYAKGAGIFMIISTDADGKEFSVQVLDHFEFKEDSHIIQEREEQERQAEQNRIDQEERDRDRAIAEAVAKEDALRREAERIERENNRWIEIQEEIFGRGGESAWLNRIASQNIQTLTFGGDSRSETYTVGNIDFQMAEINISRTVSVLGERYSFRARGSRITVYFDKKEIFRLNFSNRMLSRIVLNQPDVSLYRIIDVR
jgi:hypothetical protein